MATLLGQLIALSCALSGLAPAPVLPPGWICYHNDTAETIIIREMLPGPKPRVARAIRLSPGEVYKEFRKDPTPPMIEVTTAKLRPMALYQGPLLRTASAAFWRASSARPLAPTPVLPAPAPVPPIAPMPAKR